MVRGSEGVVCSNVVVLTADVVVSSTGKVDCFSAVVSDVMVVDSCDVE